MLGGFGLLVEVGAPEWVDTKASFPWLWAGGDPQGGEVFAGEAEETSAAFLVDEDKESIGGVRGVEGRGCAGGSALPEREEDAWFGGVVRAVLMCHAWPLECAIPDS